MSDIVLNSTDALMTAVPRRMRKESASKELPDDTYANIQSREQARQWMLSRNPDLQCVEPSQVDWRRLVYEGHRYEFLRA